MSKYAEIRARITDLQKQADDIYAAEKKAAIADIKDKIKTYDITAAELGLVKRERAAAATKAPKAAAGDVPPSSVALGFRVRGSI